jgi:hypothetical protein
MTKPGTTRSVGDRLPLEDKDADAFTRLSRQRA